MVRAKARDICEAVKCECLDGARLLSKQASPISFSALIAFPKAFLLGYIMSTQLLLIVTTSICLSGTVYTHPGFVTRGSLCERTREFQWVGENNELPQVLAMAVILEVGILV